MLDVIMKYQNIETSLEVAAVGEVENYKHPQEQIQELKVATNIVFMDFLLGTSGKWRHGDCELPKARGLFSSRREDCP